MYDHSVKRHIELNSKI